MLIIKKIMLGDRFMKENKSSSIKVKECTRKGAERKKILKKKKKARRQKFIGLMVILISILIIVPMLIGSSFIISLSSGDLVEGKDPLPNESLNILLLGTDSGDVINLENINSKKTDTIMVINYNHYSKKINLVSIPRDTLIEVDAYDGYGNLRHYWKINNARVLGGDEELVNHVEKLLEIKVNYIVEVNYKAFTNFIDAIGGIEMYIEQDMFYDDNTQDLHINFTGGETVLLDGKKSEEFFRWRENNDGSGLADGDLGRIKNQQKFIYSVIQKCLSPSIIFRVSKILDVVKEDVYTNMPANKIVTYGIKFALNKGITMSTLQGYNESLYNESFLVVDKESNRELIDSLKNGKYIEDTITRESYSILILNGTRINGLAGNLKEEMESVGYNNIEVGNSGKQNKSVIICNEKSLKEQIKLDTGIKKFAKKSDEYENYDAIIILGEDFNGEKYY